MQLISNQSNRRSMVQGYFPLQYSLRQPSQQWGSWKMSTFITFVVLELDLTTDIKITEQSFPAKAAVPKIRNHFLSKLYRSRHFFFFHRSNLESGYRKNIIIISSRKEQPVSMYFQTLGSCIIKLITTVIFRHKLECLSLNTRLGWKGLPGTNTLASYGNRKLQP